jgi:hypothetical protein
MPDRKNTDPAYWNRLLKRQGLGVDAGRLPKGKPRGKKVVRVCHAGQGRRASAHRLNVANSRPATGPA